MAFVIENVTRGPVKPDGHYVTIKGVDWLVTEITLSASGIISLKLHDPARKENQLKRVCTLEELINNLPDVDFKE